MKERIFGDDYCEGVYHGSIGTEDHIMRLEKFEEKWYMADGTGDIAAVLLVPENTSIHITNFFPDAKVTVHLFVIENLRQGAAEARDEHIEEAKCYQAEIDDLESSYDRLVEMQKVAILDLLNLRKSKNLAGIDYQQKIDDLENIIGVVKDSNADLTGSLTRARERYNDIHSKLHDREADNIDLDKRNMGLIGRCQELEEECRKLDRMSIIPVDSVVAKWSTEQYKKVQDYVLANNLHMGHEDEETHADILIVEHEYLTAKVNIIKSEILRG